MNHFKKHMQNSQEQAKHALTGIIKMNISKYVIMQRTVNDMLTSGQDLRPAKVKGKNKKEHKCGFCTINELMTRMSVHHNTAAQAASTYKMLFGGEIDLEAIISDCVEQEFGKQRKGTNNIISKDSVIMPEDAPQEVKDMCAAIQKVLRQNGKGGDMTVEVINMKGQNYGLSPENFDNFGEYAKAVSKAREEAHAIENGEKTAEEVLTKSMLHKAEETNHVDSEKLN